MGKRVSSEGAIEGSEEEGGLVGIKLGLVEGAKVGISEGWNDGAGVDTRVGLPVGTSVGNPVLRWVGRAVRRNVGTPDCPRTMGTSDGAGVGLLDWTLTETIEIRFASPGALNPLPTDDATVASTPPPAAWAELSPSSELDGGSDRDPLGSQLADPAGRAAATLANEAPLAVGTLSAACVVACALQGNVRLPLATSAAMLSAKVAADFPPAADRTRTWMAAPAFCMWNRSAATL